MLWVWAAKLRPDAPDALSDREPGGRRQYPDRPDERDRAEDDALADAVGGRVEEGAERRPLPARPRERAVEDVQHRPHDEDAGAEPVEEELVPVLEEDEDRGRDAERDAAGGERVGGDACACEAEHGAAGEPPRAERVAALQARGLAQGSDLRRAWGRAAGICGSGGARAPGAPRRRRRRRRARSGSRWPSRRTRPRAATAPRPTATTCVASPSSASRRR